MNSLQERMASHLVNTLQKSYVEDRHIFTSSLLWKMTMDEAGQDAVINVDGVVPLLLNLLNSKSTEMQLHAACSLGNIARKQSGRNLIVNYDGSVKQVLNHIKFLQKDTDVLLECVGVLCNLSYKNTVGQDAIIKETDAVKKLVELLDSSSNDMQLVAIRTLANIVENNNGQHIIITTEGFLPKLVTLIQTDDVDIQLEVLDILQNLVINPVYCNNIIQTDGMVHHIQSLLTSSSDEMKRLLKIVLSYLI